MQKLSLEPGHASYEQLKDPTLPVWKSIYFFNLTNPEGFQNGQVPNVTQVGPYSYRWDVCLAVFCRVGGEEGRGGGPLPAQQTIHHRPPRETTLWVMGHFLF